MHNRDMRRDGCIFITSHTITNRQNMHTHRPTHRTQAHAHTDTHAHTMTIIPARSAVHNVALKISKRAT